MVYRGRERGCSVIFISPLLKIHSIDFKETKCFSCKEEIFPAIFCSIVGKIESQYLCRECIVKSKVISKEDLEELVDNYLKNKDNKSSKNSSWVLNENKSNLLKKFIEIEKEDISYINDIRLIKATMFKKELEKGIVLYSEKEMFDYMNFYDNDIELVLLLRKVLLENINNKFLKDVYIQARNKKLTQKQINSLKNNREFAYLSEETEEFWEYIPVVLYSIENEYFEEGERNKIKDIIMSIIKKGFFTEKQKYVIDMFIKENLNNIDIPQK